MIIIMPVLSKLNMQWLYKLRMRDLMTINLIPIKVESHSGYKPDEYPKCLYIDDNKYEITEIVDRWYQGYANSDMRTSDYFKVRTVNGVQLIIKHDYENDIWFLCK